MTLSDKNTLIFFNNSIDFYFKIRRTYFLLILEIISLITFMFLWMYVFLGFLTENYVSTSYRSVFYVTKQYLVFIDIRFPRKLIWTKNFLNTIRYTKKTFIFMNISKLNVFDINVHFVSIYLCHSVIDTIYKPQLRSRKLWNYIKKNKYK